MDEINHKLDLILVRQVEQARVTDLIIAGLGKAGDILSIHTEMLRTLMEIADEESGDELRKLLARIELLLETQTADMKSVLSVVQQIEAR